MAYTKLARDGRLRVVVLLVVVLGIGAAVLMGAAPRRQGPIVFPQGFLWGAATAAMQVEGGNYNNDYYVWQLAGKTADMAGLADDEYHLYDQDFAMAQSMGHNANRLSIEWSRIEPKQGVFSFDEIKHYRDVLTSAHNHGLKTFVTLHHFTNPIWAYNQGSWSNPEMINWYADYVAFVVANLGDLVDKWITINEPNVMMLTGWVVGVSPPGQTNVSVAVQVLANFLKAHARAYHIIHATYPHAEVGFAHHMRVFAAYDWWNPADQLIAAFVDDFWNNQILQSIKTGHIHLSIPLIATYDEDWDDLRGTLDFVGVNYYTRDMLKLDLSSPEGFDDLTNPNAPHNDLGWEIYPQGMYTVLMRAASFGWPLYVTENGIADAADTQRQKFICDHLKEVNYAIQDGADVRGYLHWALMDNWEWEEGFAPRFGLAAVDYTTEARTVRASAIALTDAARTNTLSLADCPADGI